ncbi:hypothetical protein ETB97_003792 [Aspergillus alliaceus]|uniref:Uncharacterized protein n=1 Tax=Petromyces alliaceus TaxID=209559 RepID=A0A8H6A0N4_PETAA|nr:hypothetical protein ETB97_003792 [Aspergillus burnettii]
MAAILTKLFSLDPDLVLYAYLSWFMREASVSLYIVNLPGLWAFLRDMFPMVKSWGYKSMSPNVPNDSTLHLMPLNRGDSIRTNQVTQEGGDTPQEDNNRPVLVENKQFMVHGGKETRTGLQD